MTGSLLRWCSLKGRPLSVGRFLFSGDPEARLHRRVRSALFGGAVVLTLGAAASACSSSAPAHTADGGDSSAPNVPVATVVRGDLFNDVTLTAEFEPYQEVDLMSKIAGYVRIIKVDVGDRVRQGQVLAVLDVPEMQDEIAKASAAVEEADAEFAAASGEVTRADSAHEVAHMTHERMRRVADQEPGLVPRQEVDEVRARDLSGEAQATAARSNLKASEQRTHVTRAEHARLETLYRYATIAAPFDGVITKRYANVGAMVPAGTSSQAMPVVRIAEQKRLRLILPVPEVAAPKVRPGGKVALRVPALGRTLEGVVARVSNRVGQNTRTMDAQVDVANPDLTLIPGLYAEVDLRLEQQARTLTVPIDAIERTERGARAFVVREPGVVHVVPVTIGMETALQIEIRSGVAEGDQVVVGRHSDLKEGQRVRARPIAQAAAAAKPGA
jgi:RND family efflux transporter MFP subunit